MPHSEKKNEWHKNKEKNMKMKRKFNYLCRL